MLALDVVADVAKAQRSSGIGGGSHAHRCITYDVDIVAVIMGKNLIRCIAFICKLNGAPLGQAVTGDGGAVAVLGEVGLDTALTADIIGENVVDDLADIFENVSALHIVLIVPRGVGDVEIVPHAAVPLGIIAVKRIGNLGVNIGAYGVFRPGRIDFARRHVFDVVRKRHRDVGGVGLRRPEMDHDVFRDIRLPVQACHSLLFTNQRDRLR